ncbi:hypothetical protein V9J60_003330, partial [Vibrio cholerae]|nr:hypothetical protein [Vibrio cholerae]EJL6509806.1 hypothetical protein [Vibrio cholerae]EJL6521166.1 hypothetical protein [Vibrio cholerae]EJL6640960.1 hypothetical protein [Vibrio cholerae]EJL6942729.1 hypothetical protein [Vibrio cholerae]
HILSFYTFLLFTLNEIVSIFRLVRFQQSKRTYIDVIISFMEIAMKKSALVLISALLVSGFATAEETTTTASGTTAGSTAGTTAVGTVTATAVGITAAAVAVAAVAASNSGTGTTTTVTAAQ